MSAPFVNEPFSKDFRFDGFARDGLADGTEQDSYIEGLREKVRLGQLQHMKDQETIERLKQLNETLERNYQAIIKNIPTEDQDGDACGRDSHESRITIETPMRAEALEVPSHRLEQAIKDTMSKIGEFTAIAQSTLDGIRLNEDLAPLLTKQLLEPWIRYFDLIKASLLDILESGRAES